MTEVIAHRGASTIEVENTVAAFRRAGMIGADAVELDVRRTADGVLVIHHDPRLPDGRVIVATASSELPAAVPCLAEALDACAGMWVNVEIKNDPREPDFDSSEAIAGETVAALRERHEDDRWLISSFRVETIDRCRQLAPSISTALLTIGVPLDLDGLLVRRGHRALHPPVGVVTAELVERCHAAGLQVNPWTCDDPGRLRELAEAGVDGICTNVPDVALRVLGRA
jgi:glycerophosphoryl diester phosphodiesterase